MIPAKFDYVAAKSLGEAVRLLGQHGSSAKVLAGGHSLIPMMKLRLASPSVLIDLGRITELSFVREEADDIVIGAMTTYQTLETSTLLLTTMPLISMAAGMVGDVQVRNKGTIGGSLAHADPAADLPAAVLALEARLKAVGPAGEREIPAEAFFKGMLETALRQDEILAEIRIRKDRARNGSAYLKVPQPASGFAIVGVAASLAMDNGTCREVRIGVTGVGTVPFRAREVESGLRGTSLDDATLRSACSAAARGVDALSDIHASAEYRKQLASVYTRRAVEAAAARARG